MSSWFELCLTTCYLSKTLLGLVWISSGVSPNQTLPASWQQESQLPKLLNQNSLRWMSNQRLLVTHVKHLNEKWAGFAFIIGESAQAGKHCLPRPHLWHRAGLTCVEEWEKNKPAKWTDNTVVAAGLRFFHSCSPPSVSRSVCIQLSRTLECQFPTCWC